MPAFKKVTAKDAAQWVESTHRMTRKEYKQCKEQNMARFTAQIDGTHKKG